MTSAARSVRRARGAATSGSCVVKVLRLQAPSRHCQRWRRSFTVTGAPCAGKSCRWRSCQPYRRVDRFPQSGQTPDPVATAEISHWPSPCSASKIRMPCPRDQLDVLSTRLSYGFPTDRSRPQQKVRKNHNSWEVAEQSRATGGGGDGAKGGGRGEREPANHAPGAEPGKRVTTVSRAFRTGAATNARGRRSRGGPYLWSMPKLDYSRAAVRSRSVTLCEATLASPGPTPGMRASTSLIGNSTQACVT